MILIRQEEYSRADLDHLLLHLKDAAVTNNEKITYNAYKEFLEICYKIDINLQKDVDVYIGPGLISYLEVPSEETDDFNTIKFYLKKHRNHMISKREELLYENYCKKYLQNFEGFISLLDRKLYI